MQRVFSQADLLPEEDACLRKKCFLSVTLLYDSWFQQMDEGFVCDKGRVMMTCDVLVAGAGPAGCAAAIAAARQGARVTLIEMSGMAGGMGTAGLVPNWAPFSDGERYIHRGVALELLKRSTGVDVFDETLPVWHRIKTENLKRAYDDLLEHAGVHVLFFSILTAVDVASDGSLTSVTLGTKGGLRTIRASVFMDATGDGDLAAFAGASFDMGDAAGDLMPATLCFRLSNVTWTPGAPMPAWRELGARMRDDERFDLIRTPHCIGAPQHKGVFLFNGGHLWGVNASDPENLTQAMRAGRRLAEQYREALALYEPSLFADAELLDTAPMMGTRESRRVQGDYIITQKDYFARRVFDDQIACNAYPVDIHHSKKEAAASEKTFSTERYEPFARGESHGIPLRALMVRGLTNVMVAGRCVSCDRVVQASLRVMPPCLSMGEAAGTAAGLAIKSRVAIRDVPIGSIQENLLAHGGYLGGGIA